MEKGIRDVQPDAGIVKAPLADGGTIHSAEVLDPLGMPVQAKYGILSDGLTAVIEMAAASGIMLVPKERLNPMITTTYGTGQLIRAALDQNCRKILIGIGGSATNDGGVGMAQALGMHFVDRHGAEIGFGGGELIKISSIDRSAIDPRLSGCDIVVANTPEFL